MFIMIHLKIQGYMQHVLAKTDINNTANSHQSRHMEMHLHGYFAMHHKKS